MQGDPWEFRKVVLVFLLKRKKGWMALCRLHARYLLRSGCICDEQCFSYFFHYI